MRLTTVILIASLMQVSAAGFAQKISLSAKNASLSQVFKKIKSQAGIDFFITSDLLKQSKNVTIEVKNTELSEVLDRIFKDQPLTYAIEDKFVVVSKKEKGFFEELVARFQEIDVRGRVVDEKGEPLVGASVKVKGDGRGTTTDISGNFSLVNVDDNAVLSISFIGYVTREVEAKNEMGNIQLEIDSSRLDEVQVIAYGTTTKKFSTGNIATVTAEEIAKQPINNPLLALQGRVPGLFVSQQSGVSGANVKLNIQGINSIGNGTEPFYVVDGVPYTPQFTNSSLASGALSSVGGSTFNFVNPADIESISILKDADATAIYGSRAANGAILITTKKGKAGKTKVDVNLQNGWGHIAHKLDFLNTQQYLEMRKEAYVNAGQAIPTSTTNPNSSNYDLTVWDQNKNTNWQEVLADGTAQFTNLQGSISGGSNITQFLAGYGYSRQTTVYPDNLADVKGNVHLNLNHNSLDNKFRFNILATYLQDKNTLGAGDLMEKATRLAPNAPELYNTDGSLNFEPFPNNPAKYSFDNPLSYTKRRYRGQTNNLTAANTISYEITPGLQLNASTGFNRLSANELQINPLIAMKPDNFDLTRSANYLVKSISSWSIEPQVHYVKETKFGGLDLLIGSSFQKVNNDVLSQTGSGYANDAQLGNILAASKVTIGDVNQLEYKYNALFARINYRLNDKYIINLTARRDGSSRFGNDNKLNTFYSVGGAWLFGDEKLVKNNFSWLSTGKLRLNYGTTGNDQITDYRYLSLMETYGVDIPYGQSVGLIQSSLANPILQWEETRKTNLGLDLGLFKDKIFLNLNYYRNRSSNQLIAYQLPDITGFPSVDQNFPATVQNTGFELQLGITFIKTSNFNWYSSSNFTSQENKLIKFPGLAESGYASRLVIGKPVNIVKAYQFAGVNSQTGLYQFINSNGETTSNPRFQTDRTVIINPNPNFYAGFSNGIQYRGFALDFLVQYVSQKAQNYRFGNLPGVTGITNQPISVLNRWRKPGDITDIQKFTTNVNEIRTPYSAASTSDAAYVGASYLRLKNASFSWILPSQWLNKIKASQVKIYMQGQNLLTFTDFKGSDPETKGLGVLPPLRIITTGLQITF